MTSEQIMAVRQTLPPYMEPKKWTAAQRRLDDELWCREMMISFFAYGGTASITDENCWQFQQYLQHHLDKLGRKRFNRVRDEQLATFAKANVIYRTHEDHEGCVYNSIKWG